MGLDLPCPRTALRVEGRRAHTLDAHLARLKAGAAFLGKRVPWLDAASQELETWLGTRNSPEAGALRLRLHLELDLLEAELGPLPLTVQPYRLLVMEHPLALRRSDPATTHKGLCGPWSTQVLAAATQQGTQDALLVWPDGSLAETAIAAIGLEIEGVFLVPAPEGRVASVFEALALPAWAASMGYRICRGPISRDRIKDGNIWCMNALRGIWPATVP